MHKMMEGCNGDMPTFISKMMNTTFDSPENGCKPKTESLSDFLKNATKKKEKKDDNNSDDDEGEDDYNTLFGPLQEDGQY